MTRFSPLDRIPQEILEHIAFHVAASEFLGPPSGIIPLICLNRHTYTSLGSNNHLYARIFAAKFDTAAAERRLGPKRISPDVLSLELQRRCFYLKRLRARVDASFCQESDEEDLLLHVYLMMLENDGKNELQLREYGKIESWLRIYWFDEAGSSLASLHLLNNEWPMNDTKLSVAMWLLWFFLRLDNLHFGDSMLQLLRTFALSAHQYHLTIYPWTNFLPTRLTPTSSRVVYYCQEFRIEPAPLATPAILSFLTLLNQVAEDNPYTSLSPSMHPPITNNSLEWECEWNRCISIAEREDLLSSSFRPGSIDAVWEGFFTFTDFRDYAALLAGASPDILQGIKVVCHRQTWKLREHHLLDNDAPSSNSGVEMDREAELLCPLSAGDPLHSYFPAGSLVEEDKDGIRVQEPGRLGVLYYRRASSVRSEHNKAHPAKVKDIIITGEGHSAWGQFSLIGRVRPCDGFISVSKKYVDDGRGKWLYRGYLVGNVNGNLAGRWRDTLSPADLPGYEGCFVMSRRR